MPLRHNLIFQVNFFQRTVSNNSLFSCPVACWPRLCPEPGLSPCEQTAIECPEDFHRIKFSQQRTYHILPALSYQNHNPRNISETIAEVLWCLFSYFPKNATIFSFNFRKDKEKGKRNEINHRLHQKGKKKGKS